MRLGITLRASGLFFVACFILSCGKEVPTVNQAEQSDGELKSQVRLVKESHNSVQLDGRKDVTSASLERGCDLAYLPAKIRGYLKDADGNALKQATAVIDSRYHIYSVKTDNNGKYESITSGLCNGTDFFTICGFMTGFIGQCGTLSIAPFKADGRLDLVLNAITATTPKGACLADGAGYETTSDGCLDQWSGIIFSSRSKFMMKWQDAVKYCQGSVDGTTGWQLAPLEALKAERGFYKSGLHFAFPNNSVFWSSREKNKSTAYSVNLNYTADKKSVKALKKTKTAYALCVK